MGWLQALDMAEALNGLLAEASGAVTPTATAPAFAHAEDWDPTFSAQVGGSNPGAAVPLQLFRV